MYWVRFDPVIGSEIAKTRPALIISNDVGNDVSPRVIVAAISSARPDRVYAYQVRLPSGEGGLNRDSKVLLDQVRTVDKSRLGARLGALTPGRMAEVDQAILVSLGVRPRR